MTDFLTDYKNDKTCSINVNMTCSVNINMTKNIRQAYFTVNKTRHMTNMITDRKHDKHCSLTKYDKINCHKIQQPPPSKPLKPDCKTNRLKSSLGLPQWQNFDHKPNTSPNADGK